MNDSLFTVPLSALVYFEPYGTEFHWTCTLPGGSGGYDLDGDFVVCDRRIDASSESEARSAAAAHLESVHGIRKATFAQALDTIRPGPDVRVELDDA